jgi:hypothetical protein
VCFTANDGRDSPKLTLAVGSGDYHLLGGIAEDEPAAAPIAAEGARRQQPLYGRPFRS